MPDFPPDTSLLATVLPVTARLRWARESVDRWCIADVAVPRRMPASLATEVRGGPRHRKQR